MTTKQHVESLQSLTLIGARQSKATNWIPQPGYCTAYLNNGRSVYLGDVSMNRAIELLEANGIDCAAYRERLDEATKPFEPSAAEKSATLYQHGYGYAKPESLGEWGYSTTFGRWGRTVTFAGETPVFTYPKL